MYTDDLALCRYHPGSLEAAGWSVPLRAIGWLEHPHGFDVGETSPEILARLTDLLQQTHERFPHQRFRGIYRCTYCFAQGHTRESEWSQDNLIVPGRHEVYAAPGTVLHYVTDHHYRPPLAFLEAVVSCPDCGSEDYFEALRRVNGGREPPMETYESCKRRIRSSMEAALAFKRALGVPLLKATRTQVLAAARVVWPARSFSDLAEAVDLGGVHVTFDEQGRVLDATPSSR
jgi:hypothetical protein